MNNLYFLIGYNNYYNRKLKRSANLNAYLNECKTYIELTNCLNFNPGDGVNTTHILNDLAHLTVLAEQPDYMLVVDDNGTIMQRWFVVDCDRTRSGQYHCTLHRDVVVDAWKDIKTAPIFVEKAILKSSDTGIFNHENMTFSQIKKQADEILADRIGIPWIVGYGDFSKLDAQTGRIDFGNSEIDITPNITVAGIANYQYYNAPLVQLYFGYSYVDLHTVTRFENLSQRFRFDANEEYVWRTETGDQSEFNRYVGKTYNNAYTTEADPMDLSRQTNLLKSQFDNLESRLLTTIRNLDPEALNKRNAYYGQRDLIIKDSITNKFYKVTVNETAGLRSEGQPGAAIFDVLKSIGVNAPGFSGTVTAEAFEISLFQNVVSLTLQEITKVSSHVDMHNLPELLDAPYSMWFMPYGNFRAKLNGTTYRQNAQSSLDLATSIGQHLSGAGVSSDIQVLPYCPVQDFVNIIKRDGQGYYIDCTNIPYREIKNASEQTTNIMYVANYSQGSIEIPVTLDYYDAEKKVTYETTKYRLCSPNYSSVFEFSSQMNNGVDYIDVHFTYKPYNPYIHLAPRFNQDGMYGLNQPGDQRGLICSGNFSLTQINDVWSTYELQNVNYQSVFDREIESMELRQQVGRTADIVGGITGTIGATAQGLAAGMSTGNPYAAAAGAIVSGVSSGVGAAVDYNINEKLRNDALDLKKDMFGFALGNIQARPNTISKLTGFNNLSRFIPYLEFYECTAEEKTALINKIVYNGMTVGRIGTIDEFSSNEFRRTAGAKPEPLNYFKGLLIRCDIDGEDFHFVNAIADELSKGLYIPLGGI